MNMFYTDWLIFFIELRLKGFDQVYVQNFLNKCLDIQSERWTNEEEDEINAALHEAYE